MEVVEPKTKTKSKQRYLKRKKERKKSRKSIPKVAAEAADDASSGSSRESSPDLKPALEPKEPHRPKKRRKVEVEPSPSPSPSASLERESPPPPTISEPPADLVAFPAPSQPPAPSKSALALQGVDQALVGAQVIDATSVQPIQEDSLISPRIVKRLQDLGINELFAVQTALIPFLLQRRYRSLYVPYDPPPDACVSAPTGSGKTLAYVVPIVATLSDRIVTRLRALVVVPTRDLVSQVRETFEAIGKGHGLKIGTATGQHSFVHEQTQLVADRSSDLCGGSSKIDILICTPGRLIDHIEGTKNFTLQHLRFLVIDEADRLLAQSFQDWLSRVVAATQVPHSTNLPKLSINGDNALPIPDAVAPAHTQLLPFPDFDTFPTEKRQSSCQKLLFSATLPRDPGKLSKVGLRNVKYFLVSTQKDGSNQGVLDAVMEKFTLPATLKEHMSICDSASKPLLFFHMLINLGLRDALVFTKSVESAERLVQLWQFFSKASGNSDVLVRAFTSDLSPVERRDVLDKFKKKEFHILICSDLISRGIDISHVSHVISYDIPLDMRKYVHRVGRTARAGREGQAWSLVEEQEAKWFKGMLKEADRLNEVSRLRVAEKEMESLKGPYQTALDSLREVYSR